MEDFNGASESNGRNDWKSHSWNRCHCGSHMLLRWILAIIILGFVFCAGVHVGKFQSRHPEFGRGGYQLQIRDGKDVFYGNPGTPGMMYNFTTPAQGVSTGSATVSVPPVPPVQQ